MNIYKVFKSKSTTFYCLLILLGAANSVMYSGLLILINNSITKHTLFYDNKYNMAVYFLIISLSFVCSKVFQTYIVRLSNDILFKFETGVLEKLRYAEYEAFEKLGTEKIYTAIGDTKVLSRIPEMFINVFNAAVIALCCLGYMFYISIVGGFFILAMMGALLVIYLGRNKRIEGQLNKLRDLQNYYYKCLNDLLSGFKELKLGIKRNESLFNNYLYKNKIEERDLGVTTAIKYLDNELLGSYSWYIILGVIMYVLPMIVTMSMSQTSTFIITILYLIGPVSTLITAVPFYTRTKIALERLNQYEKDVSINIKSQIKYNDVFDIDEPLSTLRFCDVVYEYKNSDDETTFLVGPINLEIYKGDIMFIVGGNGSGKSTFINLLTGLYKPISGHIYFNDREVKHQHYPYYSNKISAIFTNNYLFNENYEGFDLTNLNAKLEYYIEEMQLSSILKIDSYSDKINHKLSKGQQKRVAMIYALMEEREILVLDEWAAEQDPSFRAYFYEVLLAELKNMGKTIIAVTHDDNYYHCGDRLIKFDYGQVMEPLFYLNK
ncbi:cyclic peptide export ABC transporter [soil metagenome]